MLERQRQEETQRRREQNLWQQTMREAELESQKLRRSEWESKQREAQVAEQKRMEAERAEAEEKRQELLKLEQCQIWENVFTEFLTELRPLKLRHQVIPTCKQNNSSFKPLLHRMTFLSKRVFSCAT